VQFVVGDAEPGELRRVLVQPRRFQASAVPSQPGVPGGVALRRACAALPAATVGVAELSSAFVALDRDRLHVEPPLDSRSTRNTFTKLVVRVGATAPMAVQTLSWPTGVAGRAFSQLKNPLRVVTGIRHGSRERGLVGTKPRSCW